MSKAELEVPATEGRSYSYPHLAYRADIDGLRAIAVLGVVLYHAFPSLMIGGFTGVDVFFVISGYLISANIYKSAALGQFSILDFYRRRIKRIFPSLALVMASCIGFGWFALFPNEYAQLGKQTALGASFLSNIGFFRESGYFDVSSITKPLLHLWSLGVEEQFYIVWPIVAVLLWRTGRFFGIFLVLSIIASFIASIIVIREDQVAAFYLPFFRFWELAMGALLAYVCRDGWKAHALYAWVGIALITLSYVFAEEGPMFPGYWALLPVFGAFFVIASTPSGWVSQHVLASSSARFLGLVSFPFYLWHWPILSFAHVILGGQPSVLVRAGAVLLSLILAIATYLFVERPLRYSKSRNVTIGLVISMIAIGAFGWYVAKTEGIPGRAAATDQEALNKLLVGPTWKYTKNDLCVSLYAPTFRYFCSQEKPSPPTVILIGNSYANHLYGGLVESERFSKQNILSYGSCEPGGYQIDCDMQEQIISEQPSIKYAIISSLWPRIREDGEIVNMISGESLNYNMSFFKRYEDFLSAKIDFLNKHGVTTIIFKPKPEVAYEPRTCFARPFAPAANSCIVSLDEVGKQQAGIVAVIDRVAAKHPEAFVFDQNPLFCNDKNCSLVKDGVPLLRDFRHYNEFGSRLIVERFADWAKARNIGIVD
ncbi:acyltransferase [Pseudomonas sp. R3-56]|uniref:acyltransferase family protein n=1 Tax=Pseudomonas sp. R3-56 TaxID=2817401 RepID=UPI003DA83086